MLEKIKKMTLTEVTAYKTQISLSSAPRETKTKLYEACENRAKELDIKSAVVVKAEIDL